MKTLLVLIFCTSKVMCTNQVGVKVYATMDECERDAPHRLIEITGGPKASSNVLYRCMTPAESLSFFPRLRWL